MGKQIKIKQRICSKSYVKNRVINMYLSRTKSKRRDIIKHEALEMFLDEGISTTSISDIALRCDITRRTIYNYFESKTELLYYLMIDIAKNLQEVFIIKYQDDKSGYDNIDFLFDKMVEGFYDNLKEFKFINQVLIHLSYFDEYDIKKDMDLIITLLCAQLEQYFINGVNDKSISKSVVESKDFANMLLSMIYGYMNNITLSGNYTKEQFIKKCYKIKILVLSYLK